MSLDDFDPNGKKPKTLVAASYVPKRSPEFKTHTKLAHAKNAVTNHMPRGGIIYEFVDGKWVEIDRREVTACEDCGRGFIYSNRIWRNKNKINIWVKPAYKAPYVCEPCWEQKYDYDIHTRYVNIKALCKRLGLDIK